VNGIEAVAVIIALFFIAGLMVGFLIVMALPAVAHRRHSRRRGPRREGDREGPGQPGWREPPRWSRTGLPGEGDVGTAADLPGDDGDA
jgi:hypothetical protein